ncbi:MAG TPA: hypothetical protein VGI92_06305 [Gemmatimonadales bacterium]|jgi:hypothetical protein
MRAFDDVELVRQRAVRMGALLAATDAPPRPLSLPAGLVARRRTPWRTWQVAAAILLLIAGAGVPPVRAWIVSTVHSVWTTLAGAPAVPATPLAQPVPAPANPAGAVSFAAIDPLVVRLSGRQAAGGTLSIVPATGNLVTAAIVGRSDAAELAIGPDGLRIINRPASDAGYVIRVPAGVSRVLVQIGGETQRSFVAPQGTDRYNVDLRVRSAASPALHE